ncbi:MAG: amidase [Dehalococcoidia bacterium]
MTASDLPYSSIADAGAAIDRLEVSPVALLDAVLARIDALDARLNAYVRLTRDSALAEAHAAEERARSGHRRSSLDGIPIAVKDLIDTAGVVTAAGTGAYHDRVPAADAEAVHRLREAGAVIVGKTNTHELAWGGTTNNRHFGATHSPWRLDRVPGGSSGGSGVAVAAGLALGALGTDTGGSIRIPAANCGVTGFKPTFGLVGRTGVVPLAATLDHVGPLARSALDCALLLDVLAGPDASDPDSEARPPDPYAASLLATPAGLEGVRLAVIPALLAGCEPPVIEAFERSLEELRRLGATVERLDPLPGRTGDEVRALVVTIISVEAATTFGALAAERGHLMSRPIRERLEASRSIPAVGYRRALDARREVERRCEAALRDGRFDAFVIPTSPVQPEAIAPDPEEEPDVPLRFRNTSLFNATRQPALSVPSGLDPEGLPTGLMFAGARWTDALVLRIGHAYQRATTHHLERPPLDVPQSPRPGFGGNAEEKARPQ